MTPKQADIAELYREYGTAIFLRCQRVLRNPDSAADATQEVFLKLTRELPRLPHRDHVLAWIYRTAMHHCLNLLRDARRHREGDQRLAELRTHDHAPADAFPDRLLAQQLLDRFDEETQTIAIAVLVDGMAQVKVARIFALSEKTIYRKLKRFLDEARRHAEEVAR